MNVYQYVALSEPDAAIRLCGKYGYRVVGRSPKDVALSLTQLVNRHGEEAVKDIFSIHPDREMMQQFLLNEVAPHVEAPKRNDFPMQMPERYMNATGEAGAQSLAFSSVISQNNTFIFAAALLVAAAIIVKH